MRIGNRLALLAAVCLLAGSSAGADGWRYYAAGEEGNPTNKSIITDGNWQIGVNKLDAKTGTITLGLGQWTSGILAGSGTLDLRGTLCTVDGVAYATKKFTPEARAPGDPGVDKRESRQTAFGGRGVGRGEELHAGGRGLGWLGPVGDEGVSRDGDSPEALPWSLPRRLAQGVAGPALHCQTPLDDYLLNEEIRRCTDTCRFC